MNRRKFLKRTTATAITTIIAPAVLAEAPANPAVILKDSYAVPASDVSDCVWINPYGDTWYWVQRSEMKALWEFEQSMERRLLEYFGDMRTSEFLKRVGRDLGKSYLSY